MFGLGFGEILLLSAIGLIVLGPKQMPQVARVIGRTIAELRKALHDVTAQVAVNLEEDSKKDKPAATKPFTVKPLPPHAPNMGKVLQTLDHLAADEPASAGAATANSQGDQKAQTDQGKKENS